MATKEKLVFKVVLCGQANVGKTTLLGALTTGAAPQRTNATIGVDFRWYEYDSQNGQKIKLQFWDTAGTERFQSSSPLTFRDARAIIFIYDITERRTFDSMETILGPALGSVGKIDPWVVVVGNKVDRQDTERQVPSAEVAQVCHRYNYTFMETSATQHIGVKTMMNTLCTTLAERFSPKDCMPSSTSKTTLSRGFKLGELPPPTDVGSQPPSVRAEITPRKASCEC